MWTIWKNINVFEALKYSSRLFSRRLGYFPITETFSVFKIKVIILKTCVINSCIIKYWSMVWVYLLYLSHIIVTRNLKLNL